MSAKRDSCVYINIKTLAVQTVKCFTYFCNCIILIVAFYSRSKAYHICQQCKGLEIPNSLIQVSVK